MMRKHLSVEDERPSISTAEGLEITFTVLPPGTWKLAAVAYEDGGDAALNPTSVADLTLSPSDPPTQAELSAVVAKLNELLAALRRQG